MDKAANETEMLDVENLHKKIEVADAEAERVQFKVYKRRWVVLALYIAYGVISAFHWIQYSIITDVIVHYYGVSSLAVNWTSVIFMLSYVVTIIPATWFYNKIGLRLALILGMGGTCLGSWVKVFSVHPDRFWVTFLGQTIVAVSQTYAVSIPVPLAATWFGSKEVSTACSIGILGPQIGGALGFFIPVMLVPDISIRDINDEIETGLNYLFYGCAIICTVFFILQLLFVQSAPPTPPSNAQASRSQQDETVLEYIKSLWKLMKNPSFVLIFFAYSMSIAVYSAMTTFLNQMIIPLYPDAQNDAGNIGVLITVSGIVGSVLVGFLLDRTRRYKEMNVIVYALSAVATIAFTFILRSQNLTFLYIIAAVYGFFIFGYLPAAYEFAVELTYPEPEASSAGVMTWGCQLLSFIYTLAYGWVFTPYGDLASNLFMSGTLVVATIFTIFAKSDLKRQRAEAHQH